MLFMLRGRTALERRRTNVIMCNIIYRNVYNNSRRNGIDRTVLKNNKVYVFICLLRRAQRIVNE